MAKTKSKKKKKSSKKRSPQPQKSQKPQEADPQLSLTNPPQPGQGVLFPDSLLDEIEVLGDGGANQPVPTGNLNLYTEDMTVIHEIGERLTKHGVAAVMKNMCTDSYQIYGNYQVWDKSDEGYYPDMVYETVTDSGFREWAWPMVRIMLKENRYNATWAMQVMIGLAVHQTIYQQAKLLTGSRKNAKRIPELEKKYASTPESV